MRTPIEYFNAAANRATSSTCFVIALGSQLIVFPGAVCGQARQFLDAPVVKSQIKVGWSPTLKAVQWAADNDDTPRKFPSQAVFLTKSSIYVSYRQLNPLSIQASVSSSAVADPGYANVTKLLDAITGAANSAIGIPGPPPTPPNPAPAGGPGAAPENCPDPAADILRLRDDLDAGLPANVGKTVASWPATIDSEFGAGLSGPQAISAGVRAMNNFVTALDTNLKRIAADRQQITSCATSATNPLKRAIYVTASLYDTNPRVQQITNLQTSVSLLADTLTKQYASLSAWTGPNHTDYVISEEIVPTYAEMQRVTVRVVTLTLKVDAATSALSSEQQPAGSATFDVRKYSSLTTEIGVGAVFSWVKQPTYGTATNAMGQTIVAKKADKSLSVNGGVLVNFVCRCGTGLLVPMVQLGANASKDLPAILIGGGFRLFGLGKGDIAIGGGIVSAWYKDLQKLKVGDVISGTNDINSDLGLISRPKFGPYFVVQYKF